jgi:hypothetical protein
MLNRLQPWQFIKEIGKQENGQRNTGCEGKQTSLGL